MKQIKICPYCKREFTTDKNARKFCKKRCAYLYSKKKAKKEKMYLCQWCAEKFAAGRRKKFCREECRKNYMKELGYVYKNVKHIPMKVTLYDAVTKSKEEGITYGRYISLHKIR